MSEMTAVQARSTIELVIFDCDGVLVDSERLAVSVHSRILADLGWYLSEKEIIDRFVGRSHEFMVSEIEGHLGRPLTSDWLADVQLLYNDALATSLTPVDGIVEALVEITLQTCVASNSRFDRIREKLERTGLYEQFAGRIFSASEVAKGKPAADLLVHAAKRMGVPPAACAVVEDSPCGVEAARAAGMLAFGYSGGVISADRLQGPDTITFDDMRELPRLVGCKREGISRCPAI